MGVASALIDRLTMGSLELISSDPVKLVRLEQARHVLRAMPPGHQGLIDAGQRPPRLVPGRKGDHGRRVGRVGVGDAGPRLPFSPFRQT